MPNNQINLRPTFQSELGDTLFPGDDFNSRELNNLVGEVVQEISRLDKPFTLSGLTETLDSMTPQFLLDSIWDSRDKQRWSSELKPKLISAFEDYFSNGGAESRLSEIADLLNRLRESGIDISNANKLEAILLVGDWREKLVRLAEVGRPVGITFTVRNDASPEVIASLMQQFMFKAQATERFLGNIKAG